MSREVTHQQWLAEARDRFGEDPREWAFVCPSCGHVARVKDWRAVGAPENAIAFSCVGRWTNPPGRDIGPVAGQPVSGPCNYAGGGLFRLNPVTVTRSGQPTFEVFEFADAPATGQAS